jgi:hypothetical protein
MTAARALLIAFAVSAMSVTVWAQDTPVPDHPAPHQQEDDPAGDGAEHQQQDAPPEHQHHAGADSAWTWTTDANVFAGYNYQERHFADVSAWESQNWFMGAGSRLIRRGRLTFASMVSFEPFTLNAHGSPELFQTGESYQRQPLLNYQHPHDLLMELGTTYAHPVGRLQSYVGADLVGSPTLGPVPFMHRESARSDPQVPLTHHVLDSTHTSTGVIRGGLSAGRLTVESSVFRGAEPDENRLNIERPRLDSWAARVQYNAGPWHAQFSGGRLHQPEWFDPFNVTLLTASVAYDGQVKSRPLNVTLAWGGHREFNGFNGNADGYLAEGQYGASRRSTFYWRAEYAGKDLFVDVHPKGFSHRSVIYEIGALTAGYVRDISVTKAGRFGLGADATVYKIPDDLLVYWANSRSFHVFLRWRPIGAVHQMAM